MKTMLTESFLSIANAARQLFRNWSAMILLAVLYAGLLASLYLLVTIREASTGQVVVTLTLAVTAPVLFFLLQTASARQTSGPGLSALLRESLSRFWKVVVVSVPLIALAIFGFYLLGKLQTYFGSDGQSASGVVQQQWRQDYAGEQPLKWSVVALTTIRYVLIGALLPLWIIHLWIATVHDGILPAIRKSRQLIVRAFAPQSVLIYMAGFLVFGVIPYLLLFKAIPATRAWLEFGLFLGRLGVVFILTLFGWVVTMSALANSGNQSRNESQPVGL